MTKHKNANILQNLNSGLKRTINWNKYLKKDPNLDPDQNLDYLFSPRFQGVNRHFLLQFENKAGRTGRAAYYLPKLEKETAALKLMAQIFLINQ